MDAKYIQQFKKGSLFDPTALILITAAIAAAAAVAVICAHIRRKKETMRR